jgi:glycosyltransferase involved in cell wall biosynthesis
MGEEQKPCVCFMATSLGCGGAEAQLVSLATRLKKHGWRVLVVSLIPLKACEKLEKAHVDELEAGGIAVTSLGIRLKLPDPRPIFRLTRLIHTWRPDILHSHMVHANLLARLVRPIVPLPVLICTAHNTYEGGRLRELLYRLTDPLCDLTTQVSRAGLERYVQIEAVPEHKIRYIANGLDTEHFYPNSGIRNRFRREAGLEDHFVWLAVGRIDVAKDYPNMLRAFAWVSRVRPEARLLIVGDGPLRREMEELGQKLDLKDRVQFQGIVDDVAQLMKAADGYVISSAWEGLPMVLLEASATGLPIVATDVGGNREVVQDGRSGILVPPKDSESLADAMISLMALSPEERERIGIIGRQYIEAQYSLDRVVDTWESLYRELLDKVDAQKQC